MKNIFEELLKSLSFVNISARIFHFTMHTENQIDLWLMNHNYEKDNTYYEMCRDACYMVCIIGMDLMKYLKNNELSDERLHKLYFGMIMFCVKFCVKILTDLIEYDLGYDNCIKYEIDPRLIELNKDALQEFAERSDINIDEIRDKIINTLTDNSQYGTHAEIMNANIEEINQHEFIQALMDGHENS